MTELKPMLLEEINYSEEIFDKYDGWLNQLKENGNRVFSFIKDGKVVGLRNRRNIPVLYLYPELNELKFDFNVAILDCEIIVEIKGKSNFYDGVAKRSHSRNEQRIKEFPVKLIVFDVLKFENEVMVMKPYSKRYEVIKNNIKPSKYIDFIKNWDNLRLLWDKVKKENQEGIVLKNPNSVYELGTRSKNYLKVKNYKFTTVTVDEREENEKGTKIYGKTIIDNKNIEVECQLQSVTPSEIGETVKVRYLDIYGKRLIQPTRKRSE